MATISRGDRVKVSVDSGVDSERIGIVLGFFKSDIDGRWMARLQYDNKDCFDNDKGSIHVSHLIKLGED